MLVARIRSYFTRFLRRGDIPAPRPPLLVVKRQLVSKQWLLINRLLEVLLADGEDEEERDDGHRNHQQDDGG